MIVVIGGIVVAFVAAMLLMVALFVGLGLVIGAAALAVGLLVKLAPVLLVAWLVVRLAGRRRDPCRLRAIPVHGPARVSADDAWLDTHG